MVAHGPIPARDSSPSSPRVIAGTSAIPEGGREAKRPSDRVPQLDGIRGIAILLVLLWHYVAIRVDPSSGPVPEIAGKSLGLAWTGVDLFFVLSGFLIGGILLDNQAAPGYFKAFYARRVTRIFPLYFSWLLIFGIVGIFIPTWSGSDPLKGLFAGVLPFWSYATFTQNFSMVVSNSYGPEWLGITWSLAIEEQFYALIPLIIRFIPRRRLPFFLFLGIAGAPLLRVLLFFVPNYNALVNQILMPSRADALLIGVLCAVAVRRPRSAELLRRHLRHIYAAFGLLLAGMVVLTLEFNTPRSIVMASFGYTWMALFYASFLLLAVIDANGLLARFTRNPFLMWLGILAYGVYLIHQSVNILAHAFLLHQWPQLQTVPDIAVTLVAFAVTLSLARFSWKYFEKPILSRGQRVGYGPSSQKSLEGESTRELPRSSPAGVSLSTDRVPFSSLD